MTRITKNLLLVCFAWSACVVSGEPGVMRFGEFKTTTINGAAGNLISSNGSFRLINSATNDSAIIFALQPFSHNGQIIARIRRPAQSTAKAGILFRQTTDPTCPFAGMLLSGRNIIFERQLNTNELPVLTVRTNQNDEWLRIVREGNAFSGFYSDDGTNWIQISADTLEMPNEIFAGFSVSGEGEAVFEEIQMASAHLASPTEKSSFLAPTNIFFRAEVKNLMNQPERVEYFADAHKIGEVRHRPYLFNWTNALAGTYSVAARITDTKGLEFFTEPINCEIGLPAARAVFLPIDAKTKGDWKGVYGKDGFVIPIDGTNIPVYLKNFSIPYPSHTWGQPTASEGTSLKRADSDTRVGTHWYSKQHAQTFVLDLTFADGKPHRVSFYFMDWDQKERVFEVQATDISGKLLATQKIGRFSNGKYLSCSVLGRVIFKIVKLSEGSMILNGLFFDSESSQTTSH